jgi:hypothetical protein
MYFDKHRKTDINYLREFAMEQFMFFMSVLFWMSYISNTITVLIDTYNKVISSH